MTERNPRKRFLMDDLDSPHAPWGSRAESRKRRGGASPRGRLTASDSDRDRDSDNDNSKLHAGPTATMEAPNSTPNPDTDMQGDIDGDDGNITAPTLAHQLVPDGEMGSSSSAGFVHVQGRDEMNPASSLDHPSPTERGGEDVVEPTQATEPSPVTGTVIGVLGDVQSTPFLPDIVIPAGRTTRSRFKGILEAVNARRRQVDEDAAIAAMLDIEEEDALCDPPSDSAEASDDEYAEVDGSSSQHESVESEVSSDPDFESASTKRKRSGYTSAVRATPRIQRSRMSGARVKSESMSPMHAPKKLRSTNPSSKSVPKSSPSTERPPKKSKQEDTSIRDFERSNQRVERVEMTSSSSYTASNHEKTTSSSAYSELLGQVRKPQSSKGEFADGLPKVFQSWDDFHATVKEYFDERYQLFKVRTSTSVINRNKTVEKSDSGELVPTEWDRYALTYKCTHGIKARRNKKQSTLTETSPSESEGSDTDECERAKPEQGDQRQARHVRYIGCTATINAKVEHLSRGKDGWAITWKSKGGHNHNVSPELFRYYCENRLPKTEATKVGELAEAGASSLNILLKLRRETGLAITRRDIQNAIAKFKRDRIVGTTAEERLETRLDEFVTQEQGNWARIYRDPETKTVQSVVWQSARMRRWFSAYPEVVMADCTHATNKSKFLLFSFVIHDVFGKGQFVQHALLHRETKDNMEDAIEAFIRNNPRVMEVRAFIVDKDFRERSLLAKYFPHARILLCLYHVIKVFAKMVKKLVRGTEKEKDEILAVLRAMMYAKSRPAYEALKLLLANTLCTYVPIEVVEDYDEERDGDEYIFGRVVSATEDAPIRAALVDDSPELDKVANVALQNAREDENSERGRRHKLFIYFLKNWESCQDEWVAFQRHNVAYLGNDTNNRIEAKWGASKHILDPSMDMEKCVRIINELQALSEDEYMTELTRTGTKELDSDDRELNQLVNVVSEHAFQLVKVEYKSVVEKAVRYSVAEKDGHAVLKSTSIPDGEGHTEHTIDVQTYRCSGLFAQVRLLPCRHVIYYRQFRDRETLIPFMHINMRWSVRNPVNNIMSGSVPEGALRVLNATKTRDQKMRQPDKYSHVMSSVLKPIAGVMALQSATAYEKSIQALEQFREAIENGIVPVVITLRDGIEQVAATEKEDSTPNASSATSVPTLEATESATETTTDTPTATEEPLLHGSALEEPRSRIPEFHIPETLSVRTARNTLKDIERRKLLKKVGKDAANYMSKEALEPREVSLADVREVIDSSTYDFRSIAPLICGISYHVASVGSKLVPNRDEYSVAASTAVRYILPEHELKQIRDDITHVSSNLSVPDSIVIGDDACGGEDVAAKYVVMVGDAAGYLSINELHTMELFDTAVDDVYKVTVGVEWLKQTQRSMKRQALVAPFDNVCSHTDANLIRSAIEACELVPLGAARTSINEVVGSLFLKIVSSEWLATADINAILACISDKYPNVGLILPDFVQFKEADRKRNAVLAFDPFKEENSHVVSIVSVSWGHWQAFYINPRAKTCVLFDSMAGGGHDYRMAKLEDVVQRCVAPHVQGGLTFERFKGLDQDDGNSCGVCSGAFLEIMIHGDEWKPELTVSGTAYRARYMVMVSEILRKQIGC